MKDEYQIYGSDGEVRTVTTWSSMLSIIPGFFALSFRAGETSNGSTGLAFTIFVWKVSMAVSLQTHR